MSKPINMATGGLMSKPPYLKNEEEKDTGITPYDVDSPESTRKGMPSRLLSKQRTRFSKGEEAEKPKDGEIPIWTEEEWEEMNAKKDKKIETLVASSNMAQSRKNAVETAVRHAAEDYEINTGEIMPPDAIEDAFLYFRKKIQGRALGGYMDEFQIAEEEPLLSKQRTRFSKGNGVKPLMPDDIPELEQHEIEPGDIAWLNKKDRKELIRLNIKKENSDTYGKLSEKEKKRIKELEKKDKEIEWKKLDNLQYGRKKKAALGGYMDNFQIAEEEPLSRGKRALGGTAALEEKYDRRKAYRAFQEGDLVEDEIVEEPLMAPVGMEEPLIEDEIAADDLAMEDAESVLDTSMLSEEEEVVVDAAIEMYPELEAILPKMVATEFTEDELVEGPGTGTSDSIPALLSDGEFVFTAKAVKNIGIDKLRKMMAQAEEAYDAGMVNQEETAELAVDETIV